MRNELGFECSIEEWSADPDPVGYGGIGDLTDSQVGDVETVTDSESTQSLVDEPNPDTLLLSAEQETLVLDHLWVVESVVNKLQPHVVPGVIRDELISAGTDGLMDAAGKFDETRGAKFSSYAYRRIEGATIDYMRELDWVSRRHRDTVKKANTTENDLGNRYGYSPSDQEVAKEMGISVERLQKARQGVESARMTSLDIELEFVTMSGAREQSGIELKETIVDGVESLRTELAVDRSLLLEALGHLTYKERHIVVATFLEGYSLAEIGEQMGVTESRISQIRTKAVRLLRERMTRHLKDTSAKTVLAGEMKEKTQTD